MPRKYSGKYSTYEGGKPSRDNSRTARLGAPLDDSKVPTSIKELEEWAIQRLTIHLRSSLESSFQTGKRGRKSGDWGDVSFDYCMEMCISGLKFHLAEVENATILFIKKRLTSSSGSREYWPAPDGFGFEFNGPHPLTSKGEVTVCEAWEIARPWFVEPEADQFSMNAIHPDFWFQGEYDLVYRWDGEVKIVDIKASKGIGDRSGDYIEQLRMYAMLWWVTHGRQVGC